jgi:hypothetical protein
MYQTHAAYEVAESDQNCEAKTMKEGLATAYCRVEALPVAKKITAKTAVNNWYLWALRRSLDTSGY